MARRGEPSTKWSEWTVSRYFSFIRSALRQAFNKYPPKYEALRRARRKVEGKGRQKWEYQCAMCGEWFQQKEVQVDHIVAAGSLTSYKDLPGFVERMFCSVDELQVLDKECHKLKTAEERKKK